MSYRRGRYSQVMLRTYGPYADTGDVYGSLALMNPSSSTDKWMRATGAIGIGLILGSFLQQDEHKGKDFISFGLGALGVSLFYFGAKPFGANNG